MIFENIFGLLGIYALIMLVYEKIILTELLRIVKAMVVQEKDS